MSKSPFNSLVVAIPALALWLVVLLGPFGISRLLNATVEGFRNQFGLVVAISYMFVIFPIALTFFPIYFIVGIVRWRLFTNNRKMFYITVAAISLAIGLLLYAADFGIFSPIIVIYLSLAWVTYVEVLDGIIRPRWPELASAPTRGP